MSTPGGPSVRSPAGSRPTRIKVLKSSDDLHLCLRRSLLILLAPRREQVFAGRRMRSLNSKWRTRFSADADTGHVATQSVEPKGLGPHTEN